jgi:uncharacterized protein DUF3618
MTTDPTPVPATRPGAMSADGAAGRQERSPAEIEAEIEQTRERLAGTVDAIAYRVKPANVARRGVDSAKAQVLDDRGQVRTTRVAAIAAGVVAVGALLFWRRSR